MIFIYKYMYTSMGNIHNCGVKTSAFLQRIPHYSSVFRNNWISLKKENKNKKLN